MSSLAEKLKSAFKNAVFLGYDQSCDFLHEALNQVEPLTYAEQKAARFSLTYGQEKTSLERAGKGLSAESRKLEIRRLLAQVAFAAAVGEAQGLAQAAGNEEVAAAVAAAKKAAGIGFKGNP